MKRLLLLIGIMLFGGCASFFSTRQQSDPISVLRNDIDTVLSDSIFRQSQSSVKVVSLNSGQVLYDRNSGLLMHPASNLKLFTSSTALQILGENFSFKTSILVDSSTVGGVVFGNLYIKGFGDPDLTSSDLDSLASIVHSTGIVQITGDVVADDSYFDDLYWGNGWMWDDEPDPDEMFISPLCVNRNCVTVTVTPTLLPSDSVLVTVDPPTPFITVQSSAKTVEDTSDHSLKVTRLFKERLNIITIRGNIPLGALPHRHKMSVWQPSMYAAELLKESLRRDSVTVTGGIRIGIVPSGSKEVAHHVRPIDSVIVTMNKISDNLSAENLLKTVGASQRGIPGNAQNGIYVENGFLSSFGIDTSACSIVDGSGVSHYNLISVDDIIRLLVGIARRPNPFRLIYTSMPIAGVDGTLENRMIDAPARGNVRGKTGTINGVSALSGYVTTRDGELLAYSMMMENFVLPTRNYQRAQDTICEILARFSRSQLTSLSR